MNGGGSSKQNAVEHVRIRASDFQPHRHVLAPTRQRTIRLKGLLARTKCQSAVTTDHLTFACLQGSQIYAVRRLIFTSIWHHKTRFSRESDGGSFDWFKSYSDISHIIHEVIPDKSARILMLGCGNSRLSEEVCYLCHHQISTFRYHTYMQMYDDGYKSITNVDVRYLQRVPIQADSLVPSTLPWSSPKCNDATAPCDRKWNVSGGSSVHTKLIRSLKGCWQTSENYLLMLAHSTLPLIKVRMPTPYLFYVFDNFFQGRWMQ